MRLDTYILRLDTSILIPLTFGNVILIRYLSLRTLGTMKTLTLPRKKQILNTAKQLFKDKGYSAASMRVLAKEVGLEPASLYSHFKSKEEILKTICFSMADEFLEIFEAINNTVPNHTDRLKTAIDAHVRIIVDNLDAASVFFNDWMYLSAESLEQFLAMRKTYEQAFRLMIEEGIFSGDFKMMDVDFTVRLTFATLNSTHEWYKPTGTVSPKDVGNKMSEFILNGISV